jgi:hypothetical protein
MSVAGNPKRSAGEFNAVDPVPKRILAAPLEVKVMIRVDLSIDPAQSSELAAFIADKII